MRTRLLALNVSEPEVLECGSLLPLSLPPNVWRGLDVDVTSTNNGRERERERTRALPDAAAIRQATWLPQSVSLREIRVVSTPRRNSKLQLQRARSGLVRESDAQQSLGGLVRPPLQRDVIETDGLRTPSG